MDFTSRFVACKIAKLQYYLGIYFLFSWNWIVFLLRPDYDHTEAEAKHLIYESDTDGDSKLSKDEILANYDLFVGSQATDFGEALTRHDEFWKYYIYELSLIYLEDLPELCFITPFFNICNKRFSALVINRIMYSKYFPLYLFVKKEYPTPNLVLTKY